MNVLYVLNGAALYGGVKVIFQHAQALRRFGVDATVVSPDPPPAWFPGAEEFCRQLPLEAVEGLTGFDIAVGTMWWTLPVARRVPATVPFHLCQCYEALYEGARGDWAAIEAVYRLPTRKLAVSPHLVDLIAERFGQQATWIPQPFEADLFRPPDSKAAHRNGKFRVLVAGAWDLPIKGVEWGLRALRPLAEEGWLELVRLALEAHPDEVALWPEAERWLHVAPAQVPQIMRSVDAYLGFSNAVEGFGLPALEAMGCGRPAVLTDIPASRALDPGATASLRVSPGDEAAVRAAVRRLAEDPALGARLGATGRSLAERFSLDRTAEVLIGAFEAGLNGLALTPVTSGRLGVV